MQILCNGSPQALPAGATVQTLVELLSIEPKGVAVAVEDALVTKVLWSSHVLNEGSRVTIIRAAQGG